MSLSVEDRQARRIPSVGVEPVMFLYMGAFMTTTVVEEAFFIYKACTANLHFPVEICRQINLPAYKNYSDQVQVEVSLFHQYQNIANYGIPVFLSFVLGAWSDRVGRKMPLLLGLCGSLFYSLMIIVNALNESWRLEVTILTACLPCALSGGQLTIFMACFAYLADTTTPEQRTIRVTLLEVAYLIPMPLGIAFGSFLFSGPLNHSFEKMFAVNVAMLASAVLYTLIWLPWRTKDLPTSVGPPCSFRHFRETAHTLFRRRKDSRRLFLFLCLFGIILYTLQRDEKRIMQIYSMKMFHWGVTEFSRFKTFMSSFYIAGLLIGVPLLKYVLKLKEVYIMIIGTLSHISARITFILAKDTFWFYFGAVLCTLGPVVAPMLRSVVSKIVPPSERGKVFALMSVADTTSPLFSGFIFSQVYIHTLNSSFPGAVFMVTIVSQIIVFLIALFMNYKLHGLTITQAKEECEDQESFH